MSYLVDRFGVLLVGFYLFRFWDRALLCNPAWPDTQKSFWDVVQGAGIMAVCQHTYLGFVLGFVSFCLLNYLALESFLFLKMAHKVQWNCMLGPAIALDLQKRGRVETASIFDLQKRGPCRDIWPLYLTFSCPSEPLGGKPCAGDSHCCVHICCPGWSWIPSLQQSSALGLPGPLRRGARHLPGSQDTFEEMLWYSERKSFSGTKARSRKAVRDSEGSGKSAWEELLMRPKEETYIKLSLPDNWACGRARGLVSRECWFMLLAAWRPLPSEPPQWAAVRLSDPPWWHSRRVFYKHRLCVCFTPWCWKWLTICKATSVHSANFPSKGNWGSSLRHSPRVSRKLDCPYWNIRNFVF